MATTPVRGSPAHLEGMRVRQLQQEAADEKLEKTSPTSSNASRWGMGPHTGSLHSWHLTVCSCWSGVPVHTSNPRILRIRTRSLFLCLTGASQHLRGGYRVVMTTRLNTT